jgi:hypothetical protein
MATYLETAMDFCRSEKAKSRKSFPQGPSRKLTLRGIADELASTGFMTGTGKPYAAAAVTRMIET